MTNGSNSPESLNSYKPNEGDGSDVGLSTDPYTKMDLKQKLGPWKVTTVVSSIVDGQSGAVEQPFGLTYLYVRCILYKKVTHVVG